MHKIITAGARWAASALRPAVKPAIARLYELDDHLLRDIGLTRADIANYKEPSPVPSAYSQVERIKGSRQCMT